MGESKYIEDLETGENSKETFNGTILRLDQDLKVELS